MLNLDRIKERMEIVGSDGLHVGIVDRVEGDRLKLTRSESGQGSEMPHRYLAGSLVAAVEGNKVRLSASNDKGALFMPAAAPVRTPIVAADPTQHKFTPDKPVWNWNRIGLTAAAIGAAAAGAAGAAFLARRNAADDDFEYRLETDENVRLISSDKVEGTKVIGRDGETLGEIKSFMVDKYTGRVAYAIMTFGGKMGFGNSFFPLPWPVLEYDMERDGYALDVTREQLAKAPRFGSGGAADFTPEYRRKLIHFYRPA